MKTFKEFLERPVGHENKEDKLQESVMRQTSDVMTIKNGTDVVKFEKGTGSRTGGLTIHAQEGNDLVVVQMPKEDLDSLRKFLAKI